MENKKVEDKKALQPIKKQLKEYIKLIPKIVTLFIDLLRDPRVSATDKAILAATVAYILNPVDLVPDWIPFLGQVDDIYLAALAILRLFLRTDENIIKEHWKGPEDIITTMRKIADIAVFFLPPKIKEALFAKVEGSQSSS